MLITNGKVITWGCPNEILEGYSLYIKDGLILEIGPDREMKEKYSGETSLNAHSQYIMPGNICAHTHFYGAYSRGMGIPGAAPNAFPRILEKLWWPLDKALTPEAVRYSALVCLIDAVRHGTTTLFDHHASPSCIDGSLDWIAEAVLETGVRASLCYEVTDRNGKDGALKGIQENIRFGRQISAHNSGGMLSAKFGLHASLTLSEETLDACREANGGELGFHIHVAEHSSDEYDSLYKSGSRVIERLEKHQILGNRSIIVHAVHIDPREMQILAETGTWVTHQPRSNMNNAVGLPDVTGMLRMGIKVGLGNDGFSNTMWDEWKAAYLAHKLIRMDPRWMQADTIAQMAIENNRDLAAASFDCAPIGIIAPGAVADLIFVDYHPYTPLTPENLPWHIVFGFNESMITTTIVNGKILMENRELKTLDEDKIAYEAMKLAPGIWQRYNSQFDENGEVL